MPVLSVDQIVQHIPALQGKCGVNFINRLMHLLSLDKINQAYDKISTLEGCEFADKILRELGVNYQVGNAEILSELPKEQAFITVSNHPYGALDGLIVADLIGHLRSDYKIIVNKILMLVKTMNNCFISVQPTLEEKNAAVKENIAGIKQVIAQLSGNHPIGIFPAGAVSDYHFKDNCVRDREWQESILRLIQRAQVPIVPIRFFDLNSKFFIFWD
jgi:Putative hemolysin